MRKIVLLALIFAGCAGTGIRIQGSPFSGEYLSRGIDSGLILRVRGDGGYSLVQYSAYAKDWVTEGKWSLKGPSLLLAPYPERPWILTLSVDRETLSSLDGTLTFIRQRKKPNKAPEPTPTSVTAPANERRIE